MKLRTAFFIVFCVSLSNFPPPVVAQSYFANTLFLIEGFNPKSGRSIWRYTTAEEDWHRADTVSGLVLIFSRKHRTLVGIEVASGDVKWRRHVEATRNQNVGPNEIPNSRLFTYDERYLIDTESGNLVHDTGPNGRIYLSGGRLFEVQPHRIGGDDPAHVLPARQGLVRLNERTGSPMWSLDVENPATHVAFVDTRFFLTAGAEVTLYDQATGEKLWSTPLEDEYFKPAGCGSVSWSNLEVADTVDFAARRWLSSRTHGFGGKNVVLVNLIDSLAALSLADGKVVACAASYEMHIRDGELIIGGESEETDEQDDTLLEEDPIDWKRAYIADQETKLGVLRFDTGELVSPAPQAPDDFVYYRVSAGDAVAVRYGVPRRQQESEFRKFLATHPKREPYTPRPEKHNFAPPLLDRR